MIYKVFAFICYLSGPCDYAVHKNNYSDLDACLRKAVSVQIELTEKTLKNGTPANVVTGCEEKNTKA